GARGAGRGARGRRAGAGAAGGRRARARRSRGRDGRRRGGRDRGRRGGRDGRRRGGRDRRRRGGRHRRRGRRRQAARGGGRRRRGDLRVERRHAVVDQQLDGRGVAERLAVGAELGLELREAALGGILELRLHLVDAVLVVGIRGFPGRRGLLVALEEALR